MVQFPLHDEKVWRDGSAEADGWKPTAVALRPRTRAKGSRVGLSQSFV